MRPIRKSPPARERSLAVDWHDSVWSPRIVVQSRWGGAPNEPSSQRLDAPTPVREGARPTHPAQLGLKPLPAPASHFTCYTLQFVHY